MTKHVYTKRFYVKNNILSLHFYCMKKSISMLAVMTSGIVMFCNLGFLTENEVNSSELMMIEIEVLSDPEMNPWELWFFKD